MIHASWSWSQLTRLVVGPINAELETNIIRFEQVATTQQGIENEA